MEGSNELIQQWHSLFPSFLTTMKIHKQKEDKEDGLMLPSLLPSFLQNDLLAVIIKVKQLCNLVFILFLFVFSL